MWSSISCLLTNYSKVTKILYFCDGLSIHDKNFIDCLSGKIQLDVLDLKSIGVSNPTELIRNRNPKTIIVTPVNDIIDLVPDNFNGALIGISLAFDLNEIYTEKEKKLAKLRLARLNGVVVDSDFTKEKLVRDYRYAGRILKIVYGLRNPSLEIADEPISNLKQLLVTRTWTTLHNNELILKAFLSLRSKHELSITFIEPPNTYEQIGDAIKLQLESTGVKFIEPMSNESLRQLFPDYGVYISASKSDGTSISLLEAMDANRICLVSDFPSNTEIVVDGENGFLFENGNLESLKKKIVEIQSLTSHEAKIIGKRAKSTVKELANWVQHSEELVEFCISFEEKVN
jgi:glycosyltransferase involved in cell wall biosynthesis